MTVYVVAIPWDAYSAAGALAFSSREKAQQHCDKVNTREDMSVHLEVTECDVL